MNKRTVSKRIFLSNALMIVVTLALILLVNMAVVKVYWESMERDWKVSMESMVDSIEVEDMLEEWTIHQRSFYLLLLADALVCAGVLIVVSLIFTGTLVQHIRKPLNVLESGAERIRNNVLTEDIAYTGDAEFEEICDTFNEMQEHILKEQEKNRKYEQARTEMIAGISHDLRTPLTAIRGTVKGLMDGVVTQPQQQEKFLRTAYRRTEEMEILLNQLFYVAKLETGNMPIHLEKLDLVSFIRSYVKGKMEFSVQQPVEITAEIGENEGIAMADAEQLSRIFDNLVENSIKYGEKDSLKIQISLSTTKEGFCICFADNGVGVPEDKLKYIFDEFYRGDESRNKKEGNGLGLYIVKCLMEAMGGSVRAENKDGLTFYLELKKGE